MLGSGFKIHGLFNEIARRCLLDTFLPSLLSHFFHCVALPPSPVIWKPPITNTVHNSRNPLQQSLPGLDANAAALQPSRRPRSRGLRVLLLPPIDPSEPLLFLSTLTHNVPSSWLQFHKSRKSLSLPFPIFFQTPSKKIQSPDDIRRFQDSDSGKNFLGFVVALSESIRGHKISDPCHESDTVNSIVAVLDSLIQWVEEIPPVQLAGRYDNIAYRIWHSRLESDCDSLMLRFLQEQLHSATIKIGPYFTDSFGISSRIDYRTGHETNFAAWLYCLARLGLIKEEDYHAVVARVFVRYLEFMMKLQLVYNSEPAESHGVGVMKHSDSNPHALQNGCVVYQEE